MALVLTDSKHYHDIAEALRASNGTDAKYKPEEMAAAIASGSGSKLDHTVTFNDENGKPIAIYSVKNGIGNIYAPSGTEVIKWKDDNGNSISFPIDPSSDIILIPDNKNASDVLYYEFNKNEDDYPIIMIVMYTNDSYVYFAKTINDAESGYVALGAPITVRVKKTVPSKNIDDVVDFFVNNKSIAEISSTSSNISGAFGSAPSPKYLHGANFSGFTNFD